MALRLGAALGRFWILGGHFNEGWIFLERALAESQGVMVSIRAKALIAAVWLALNRDDIDLAETLCEESLALSRELSDKEGIADTLYGLGHVAMRRGDLDVACVLVEEAVSLSREMGDRWRIASGIHDLAWVRLERGEYARARAMYEECLVVFRELGDKFGIAANAAEFLWRRSELPSGTSAFCVQRAHSFRHPPQPSLPRNFYPRHSSRLP